MGVTTTNNKPLNPRAQDASPLAYNRAALYSGKALSFDGVNDSVSVAALDIATTTNLSFSCYFKTTQSSQSYIYENDSFYVSLYRDNATTPGELSLYISSGGWLDTGLIVNDGHWYHLVVSILDGTPKVYLNGQLSYTGATRTYNNSVSSQSIGMRNNSSFLNGQLTNFKIFNVGLTAAQIADLYNFPEKIVPTGVDNTALKLWLPMMESAGTTAINGAPDALGTEEVTNGDFATDSDWTKVQSTISNGKATITSADGSYAGVYQNFLTIGKTYSYSIDVYSVTNGVSIFSGSSLSRLMTSPGNYKGTFVATNIRLEIKRNADDIMSAEIDNVSVKEQSGFGTISGATWTNGIGAPVAQTAVINWNKVSDGTNSVLIPQGLTTGRDLLGNLFENVRKQGALNLDGNSWAEVHDNASLEMPNTDNVTMELWFKRTETPVDTYIKWIDVGQALSNETNYSLGTIGTQDEVFVEWRTSSSGWIFTDTDVVFNKNEWNHIIVTIEMTGANSSIKTYKNGSLYSTKSKTTTRGTGGFVNIGKSRWSSTKVTSDQIAQPRIYNRALTAEEVQRNYNAGKNIYS
mgnify:CR=1 FL=1